MAAPILSEQETRELASAQPNTAFAYMMHGGSGAADPNRVSLFHIDVPAVRDSSTKDVYDFWRGRCALPPPGSAGMLSAAAVVVSSSPASPSST